VVFHLAAAVSAECEADFDLGMRSNLDTTRALLEAVRTAGNRPRVIFASTVAVFGNDPELKLPLVVRDDTLPMYTFTADIHRAASTKVFSLLVISIMWFVTIAVVLITFQVVVRGREVTAPLIGSFVALLFALPAVRNVQPNVPPIGTLGDIVGLFFNMLIVSACAVILMLLFTMQDRPDTRVAKPGAAQPPAPQSRGMEEDTAENLAVPSFQSPPPPLFAPPTSPPPPIPGQDAARPSSSIMADRSRTSFTPAEPRAAPERSSVLTQARDSMVNRFPLPPFNTPMATAQTVGASQVTTELINDSAPSTPIHSSGSKEQ